MMISCDFKEKKSGRIELKTFSALAVEVMVRFLYGFEVVGLFGKLDTALEIAEMGSLYSIEGLMEDALECASYTKKGDVFKVLQFAKQHGMDKQVSDCAEYISKQFSIEEMKAEESFLYYPEVLIEILKLKDNILKRPSVLAFYDDIRPERYLLWEEFSLTLKSSEDISVTGLGLFLAVGGKVWVHVTSHIGCDIEQTVQNKDGSKTTVPLFFKDEMKMKKNVFYKISIKTSCSVDDESYRSVGQFRQGKRISTKCSLGDTDQNPFDGRLVDAVVLSVPGRDNQGDSAGDVDFTLCQPGSLPWAELYFYVGHQVNN